MSEVLERDPPVATAAPAFVLTERQREAMEIMAAPTSRHILLYGGSRSGKTALIIRAMCLRALRAPGSRHAALRFRFNACKASIALDTFPKVMRLAFPSIGYQIDKTSWFAAFPNGSELWFAGLDDKERTEKILGQEFATLLLSECSQISWQARGLVVTRLAQHVEEQVAGRPAKYLPLRMYYDENPPDKAHWSYRYFVQHIDPETREPIRNPEEVVAIQMNPRDNLANLPADYLDTLRTLSPRLRRRFLDGEFKEANPDALFPEQSLDKWRVLDVELPDMQRIIIAVDPSGAGETDNEENDEIGITVSGLGIDGIGYLLEDLTCKAGPATWGKIVASAVDRHDADLVVAEGNFGGAMVQHVIRTARSGTPFKKVTASRGKVVRAEPLSPLVDDGRIRLVGHFHRLEDELAGFTTRGYSGDGSPNRADAFVWGFTELFSGIVNPRKPRKQAADEDDTEQMNHAQSWMA